MFGDKIKGFEPYVPFDYSVGQIRLDANESPFDLPSELKAEILNKINLVTFDRYPDPYAKKLCTAFADYYSICNDNVIAGNGSDELLSLIFSVSLRKGSKVTVVTPDFSMYSFYSRLGENSVQVYSKNIDSHFSPEDFLEFSKDADIAILSNPCNPTGQIISSNDILTVADGFDGLFIVDEAYMDFADESVISYCSQYDNLMVLKTLSKSFGCAAVRIGFAVSSKNNIDIIKTIKSPYNLNSISQAVGEIILKNKEYAQQRLSQIKDSRDFLFENLSAFNSEDFKVYPTWANFVYIKTKKASVIYKMLLDRGIVVRCFKDALRITAGLPEENRKLISAFEEIKDTLL